MVPVPQITSRNKADFLLFLKIRLGRMTRRERAAFLRRKAGRNVYPIAIERKYAKDISDSMRRLVDRSLELLTPLLSRYMPTTDSQHIDSEADDIEKFLAELDEEANRMFSAGASMGQVLYYITMTTFKTFNFAEEYWQSQVRLILGSPLSTDVVWWESAKRLWEQENFRLIKSLAQGYISDLNAYLIESFQSGRSFREIVAGIEKIADGVVGYKARRIARDQVGKLQYAITRKQFESIGMDGYLWTTARDERVRGNPTGRYPKAIPSHWAIDGMICKFSDPTVFSEDVANTWQKRYTSMPLVHPGQAIMCRCTATPFWLPLIREAEQGLSE